MENLDRIALHPRPCDKIETHNGRYVEVNVVKESMVYCEDSKTGPYRVTSAAWRNLVFKAWEDGVILNIHEGEGVKMEKFIVKHYSEDERPIIKGNGFDGLEIGNDREDAEDFIVFVNALIEEREVE